MISNVCLKLKISESLFEASCVPETIKDALYYLYHIEDIETIPVHIKNLFQAISFNQHKEYRDEYIIRKVEYLWLVSEIKKEFENVDQTKSKFDVLYKCILLCIEHYKIYKILGSFKNTMQDKINEIIDFKDVVDRNHHLLYKKSLELQDLHIANMLVNSNMIRDEFKLPVG